MLKGIEAVPQAYAASDCSSDQRDLSCTDSLDMNFRYGQLHGLNEGLVSDTCDAA